MDPLSISMACLTLAELMFKVSRVTSSFLSGIRAAEADVNEITAEFESISTTMKFLTKEFIEKTPENLRGKISDVVASYDVAHLLKKVRRIDRHLSDKGKNLMLRRWLTDTSSYSGSIFTSAGLDTAVLRQHYGVPPEATSSLHQTFRSMNRGSVYSVVSWRECEPDGEFVSDSYKKQWKGDIAVTMALQMGEAAQSRRKNFAKHRLNPSATSDLYLTTSQVSSHDQNRGLSRNLPARALQEGPARSTMSLLSSYEDPPRDLRLGNVRSRVFKWISQKLSR
ncbi:hypothetical protein Daesc_007548 [Daldinia eschscholtzii]|uniref:Fungal N-terminal domain-containing protein n=1 Tax=Daldinia eschscholtzii TaxID=292717 RepID=A0AAX6MEG3_9PEZI